MLAVLDAHDVDRVHYIGYSLGGHVGFAMARHAPDRLASLVVGGMHPYARDPEPLDGRIAALADGMVSFVEQLEFWLGTRQPEPFRSVTLANDAEALIASTIASREEPSLGDALAAMSVPVLIYCGTDDPTHPDALRCASEIPAAMFVSLDGVDHMRAMSEAELVLPHITRHLVGATRT